MRSGTDELVRSLYESDYGLEMAALAQEELWLSRLNQRYLKSL